MSYRDRDPRDYRPDRSEFENSRPDQYGQEHYGPRQFGQFSAKSVAPARRTARAMAIT